ncbi:MAG TPA: helix-turn-helix domain-containing protein [Actinophytocola sp.]|uniref:TetR/AcrR family transcriptional regulator n=1 Tax=Actinophytocola sp. TaxID=1872138 RepID=UPI002DDD65A8|nr:helix-turn-helix domain-containing protein [Actinophytocola sp.]HEV2780267.1 helix-turn-helix domain-containing protein [Actinophytocola sp.]
MTQSPPMSGRKAEAARNDTRILQAAREVFVANPDSPISAVAERAGVGISALYRRYPSKEDLLRTLSANGLRTYLDAVEEALENADDVAGAWARFLERVVEADTHALTTALAGTFTPTEELYRDSELARVSNERLVERAKQAGVVRKDLDVNDLSFIFEQLSAVRLGDEQRTRILRRRYLTLYLRAMRPDPTEPDPLPGPPPTWQEIGERWAPK